MEAKKSPKANLENKRFIFAQLGIIAALLIVLSAFEYKSYDTFTSIEVNPGNSGFLIEDHPPITKPPEPKEPEAPKMIQPEIKVVEDTKEIKSDLVFVGPEIKANEAVEPYEMIELPPEDPIIDDTPVVVAEEKPEFPGGEDALYKFLYKNLNYPVMARESNVQGTVYIMFVVEKDGSITNIRIGRGIGAGCDEEAVRVIQLMPNWKPASKFNRPVRFSYTLPVRFILQ